MLKVHLQVTDNFSELIIGSFTRLLSFFDNFISISDNK